MSDNIQPPRSEIGMRFFLRLFLTLVAVTLTIFMVRAMDSRSQRPLDIEHRIRLDAEFQADTNAELDWAGYRTLENRIQKELHDKLGDRADEASRLNRHSSSSMANPENHERNWNFSYQSNAGDKGVAVLLHGLSDSPYSMRSVADTFISEGFSVYAPRLPGHGFAVGDLRHRTREDWSAVVRLTVKEALDAKEPTAPMILVGYSNGGLLALKHALDCGADGALGCPDGIVLISPAVSVTPFAWLGWLHRIVSWHPYFEQFGWDTIYPEIDPYKFSSFPKNVGPEIASLTQEVNDRLAVNHPQLPSVLAFQSAVDATVSTTAVLDMFMKLSGNNDELVLYDLNRVAVFSDWLSHKLSDVYTFEGREPFDFSLTILSNRSSMDSKLATFNRAPGEIRLRKQEIEEAWPADIYSLSHIALPFKPDDPLYGRKGSALSAENPKGEKRMLYVDAGYFQRLRYNPFYSWQETRMRSWINGLGVSSPTNHRHKETAHEIK